MKKLGTILAVVSQENCQPDDKPATEQQCERPACESRWYMTDWSEVGLRLVYTAAFVSALAYNRIITQHNYTGADPQSCIGLHYVAQ